MAAFIGVSVYGGRVRSRVAVSGRRAAICAPNRFARKAVAMMAEQITLTLDEQTDKLYGVDAATGKPRELSLKEKEELFLDTTYALFSGLEPPISNEMIDMLRDELSWEGSRTVMLNDDELRFIDYAKAYSEGKSKVSDEEYDKLKDKLRKANSMLVIRDGATCSIITQTCKSDLIQDKLREAVLLLPGAGISALAWAFISFELTPLRSYNPLISFTVGLPLYFLSSKLLTSIVLPDPHILVGPCPSCETEIRTYFGNVVGIEGFKDVAKVKCPQCKAELVIDRNKQKAETVPKQLV